MRHLGAQMAKSKRSRDERLIVRQLRRSDLAAIAKIHEVAFPGVPSWSKEQFSNHLRVFPEGQIGVELDGELVATSASMLVEGSAYQDPHTYRQVSDSGTMNTHDPEGDTLYALDIAVHPRLRGLRMARRVYDARKQLVRTRNLRGIMFGGRIPGYHQHATELSPDEYVRRVVTKQIRDRTMQAQLANGFSIRRVLPAYLPADKESMGYAILMEWLNPAYVPAGDRAQAQSVRVAAVQYQMRPIHTFEDFCHQCEFYMDTSAEYRCDFLVFPELLTTQLQSLVPAERPGAAARRLDEFTQRYLDFFSQCAIRYYVNIIGGTHLIVEDGKLHNAAYLFRRDGSIERQVKLHITPSEQRWWGISPGRELNVFETDRGPISILICYDIEFPELARIAAARGARIFFVPYNTDIRSAHIRVRACAQARCIENHVYCVLSGATGNLPFTEGADIHYAQSAILTPSDIPFPRDGIATEATPNVEAILIHDLDMNTLRRNRRTGIVRPWFDRRTDIYRVRYREGKKNHDL